MQLDSSWPSVAERDVKCFGNRQGLWNVVDAVGVTGAAGESWRHVQIVAEAGLHLLLQPG